MSVGKIVRHFEALGKVPVDIKDVLAEVRTIVDTVTIKVRGVDVPLERLKGNCYRYKVDDAPEGVLLPKQIAMIVYNKRLHPAASAMTICAGAFFITIAMLLYLQTQSAHDR